MTPARTPRRVPKVLAVLVMAVVAIAAAQGLKFPGGDYKSNDGTNDIVLSFDTTGTLTVYVNNEPFSNGTWEAKADTLMFSALEAPEGYGCAGDGKYTWAVANNQLTVKVVNDDCQIRVQYFTSLTWMKG
jgi:hypothetical protein